MRVEEELEQSKHQFQRLFEVIVDPIVIVDLAGKILDFSQSAEEGLGFTRKELVGKHILETMVVTNATKEIMEKILKNKKPFSCNSQTRVKMGFTATSWNNKKDNLDHSEGVLFYMIC